MVYQTVGRGRVGMANPNERGLEALHRLKSTEPPLWLAPSPELSIAARAASQHLFSSLQPFCPKSPFERLLVDGFDAEQIWQQIDLQTRPLLSNLRRELSRFERNPKEISGPFGGEIKGKVVEDNVEGFETESKGLEELEGVEDGFEDLEDMDDEDMREFNDNDEEEEEEEDEEEQGGGGGVEDKFLKIKDLEEYMEKDEAREYGVSKKKRGDREAENVEDEKDEDEEDDDELGAFGSGGDEDEGTDRLENARYEDFFGTKKKKVFKGRLETFDGSEDVDADGEQEGDWSSDSQKKETLSTHEKQLKKVHDKIEQMEKANLEPKAWTMLGEVTAAKRPKDSALEVDLDFEHNVKPAPVITEEVTASLEDLICKRIIEGHYNGPQKAPSLPSKAPKQLKELDENKSKKGLAEIYEEEYVQKTDLASAPLLFSDEQKKEATLLFKRLCLKLDALSHFHFTPKPVIEDMAIQANVPALAMEEIAPVAISDAAMLAPEEVFSGKGDVKEEAELTQADKKRRRANKKRKFKVERSKQMAKKARDNTLLNHADGKEES